MTKQMTKPGLMTGTLYRFPEQIKELDREYEEWFKARHGVEAPAVDGTVTIPTRPTPTGANTPDPARQALFNEAVQYIREYTGRFGLILDLRAQQSWGTKWFRLSDRQIEVVLASKRREEQWAKERAPKAEQPVAAPAGEGWYKQGDDYYKVQIAIHGSKRPYAKVLRVDGDTATWEYAPGMVNRLTEADRLTEEDARAFGRLYGICVVCGAPLTNEESIEYGIGPICRGKAFGA